MTAQASASRPSTTVSTRRCSEPRPSMADSLRRSDRSSSCGSIRARAVGHTQPLGAAGRDTVRAVPDRKPPRLVGGGERVTLRTLLQYQRDSVVGKLHGLDESEAMRVLVPSGISLLWLVKHLTRAERLWIIHRFAGWSEFALPSDAIEVQDTVESVIGAYRAAWAEVDSIVDAAALDQRCVDVGDESMVDLRWVLTHLLEETARHAGHADILRELIDGSTGR